VASLTREVLFAGSERLPLAMAEAVRAVGGAGRPFAACVDEVAESLLEMFASCSGVELWAHRPARSVDSENIIVTVWNAIRA